MSESPVVRCKRDRLSLDNRILSDGIETPSFSEGYSGALSQVFFGFKEKTVMNSGARIISLVLTRFLAAGFSGALRVPVESELHIPPAHSHYFCEISIVDVTLGTPSFRDFLI